MRNSIARWGAAFLIVVAVLLVLRIYGGTNQPAQDDNTPPPYNPVQEAPDFTLSDLHGNQVSLKDFRGKNVFLNFWATGCPYCKAEMPDIEKIYQEYKEKDLVVLTVNTGENKETVKNFIERNNYHFPVLLDTSLKAVRLYKVSGIPVSVFIDKQGYIVSRKIGVMNHEQMKTYIQNLDK